MGIHFLEVHALGRPREGFGVVRGRNQPRLAVHGYFKTHSVALREGKTFLSLSFDTDPFSQGPSRIGTETFFGENCDFLLRFVYMEDEEPIPLNKMKIAFMSRVRLESGHENDYLTENGQRMANLRMESVISDSHSAKWDAGKALIEEMTIPCEHANIDVFVPGQYEPPEQYIWQTPASVLVDFSNKYASKININ